MSEKLNTLIIEARKFIKIIKILAVIWIIAFIGLATIATIDFLLSVDAGMNFINALQRSLLLFKR